LHDTWLDLLDNDEKQHHFMAFWNKALKILSNNNDKDYLIQRYE